MRRLLLFCLLCFPVCLKADELFDYKKIPFPEPANFKEAKPDDVINGLRFLSMKENLSKDQRSRILAAARRIDPLHREAFTESYRLANGLSFEIDKGFSEKQKTDFFENSVAPLRKNSDFSEYLGFIDDAIKNQPFTSSTPKVTPGENTSGPRSIGFLSTKGFIPIRANSQRISSPNFQFVPKNLESFFFLSAYRETLKYFALHEGKSLSGKRITFEANLTNAKTEGPGAVLPTAILTSAFAGNFATTSDVAFVGDVNADGSIQPMGDILDRLTANPKNLPKIIVIPKDDAAVADDILILHGPSVFSKTQIVAVGNLEEAVGLVEAKRSAEMKEAINLFSQVQKVLNKPDGGKYLRNNYFVERVDRVFKTRTPPFVGPANQTRFPNVACPDRSVSTPPSKSFLQRSNRSLKPNPKSIKAAISIQKDWPGSIDFVPGSILPLPN